MKKYTLQGCIMFFCIILGVGIVGEINNKNTISDEVNGFEQNIENNEEINDGSMSNVRLEKEDTSNLISNINAKLATFIVDGLNEGLKVVINLISSITN
jgi:hypothetical protein